MSHLNISVLVIGIICGLIGILCLGFGIYSQKHHTKMHPTMKNLDGKWWIGIGILLLALMIVIVIPRH